MSESVPASEVAAGWHPDPNGRAHFRYWDGQAWTGQVSTWGQTWSDPPGAGPGQLDGSLLAAPSLAFAYGATGIEGAGTWSIWEPSGRQVGEVVVEVQGSFMPRRRYVYLNPARQVVLVMDPLEGFMAVDANVLDWTGRPHGFFDGKAFSNQVLFNVGGSVYGSARATDQAQGFNFGAVVEDHYAVDLYDGNNAPYGRLVNHESRRGIGSWFGVDAEVGQLMPEQSYFELHRPPDLAEPLRSFTLAFPALFAYRVHAAREARRRRRRHHHHH